MTTSGQVPCWMGGKQGDETLSLSSGGSQAGGRHRAFVMVSPGVAGWGGEFEGRRRGCQHLLERRGDGFPGEMLSQQSLGTIRVAAKGLGGGEDEDIRAEGAASVSSEAPRRCLGGTCNSMC